MKKMMIGCLSSFAEYYEKMACVRQISPYGLFIFIDMQLFVVFCTSCYSINSLIIG